jgi:hypothetical protein
MKNRCLVLANTPELLYSAIFDRYVPRIGVFSVGIEPSVVKCSEHCVCFDGKCKEQNYRKFRKQVQPLYEKIYKDIIKDRFTISIETFVGVKGEMKGKHRFGISLNTLAGAGENINRYRDMFPTLNPILELSKTLEWKPDGGTSCTDLLFDKDKSKLVGELVLPTTIPSNPAFANKLGKPSLSGFTMHFEESPVGLNQVEIYHTKEILEIRLQHSFKPSGEKDILPLTFNKSVELSKLFAVNK